MDDIQAVALIAMVARMLDVNGQEARRGYAIVEDNGVYVEGARRMLDESRRQVVAARQTDAPPAEPNAHVAEPFRGIMKGLALGVAS